MTLFSKQILMNSLRKKNKIGTKKLSERKKNTTLYSLIE